MPPQLFPPYRLKKPIMQAIGIAPITNLAGEISGKLSGTLHRTLNSAVENLAVNFELDHSITLDDQFRAQATQVLGRFREAMERIVYSTTKALQNSRSLLNVLGVDLNVSWQIFKLLGQIDTLSTVSYVPAAVSVRKLLNAARKRGVEQQILDEAAAAFTAFQHLVSETTGDRDQFESVVMSYANSAEAVQIGMQHRKDAFKADVHFFGVVVDTLVFSVFFHPGQAPDSMDFLTVRQMLGLRRLRASTDVVVERFKLNSDRPGKENEFLLSHAIDLEAATTYDAAVLPEFCTQPLLPLTTTMEETGDVRTLVKHRDIAVGREVDITTARCHRGGTVQRTPDGRPVFEGLIEVGRPTRVQIIDTFIHRPSWPELSITSGVYAHLPRRVVAKVPEEGVLLPFSEKLAFMGTGSDVMRISESPRYPELIKHSCQKMGWKVEDFDLYRIRHEYPLMDSNILSRLESVSP
jgi:hypothetical protein